MRRFRVPLLPRSFRWSGVLAVAAILTYFSLLAVPPPQPPEPGPFWDKKLHFAGYAALGLSLLYATATDRDDPTRRFALAVGAAVAFGVLIEALQGPIPYRYFSYADMLANALGALLATAWLAVEPRIEYVRIPR